MRLLPCGAVVVLLSACATEAPSRAEPQAGPPAPATSSPVAPSPVASSAVGAAREEAPTSAASVVAFTVPVDRSRGARFDVVRLDLSPAAREALVEVEAPAGWAVARQWEDSDGFWDRGRLQAGVEARAPAGQPARSVTLTLLVRAPSFVDALKAEATRRGAGPRPRLHAVIGTLDARGLVVTEGQFEWLDLFPTPSEGARSK